MSNTTTEVQADEAMGRSARKRQAILDAATRVFLQKGYLGTSMDEIAASAAVSKQTVYKHFADKEALFNAIVLGTVDQVADDIDDAVSPAQGAGGDAKKQVRAQAQGLIESIMRPEVLQVRRLIIAEAARFPELCSTWYEQGFRRGLARVADVLEPLAADGSLRIEDPLAAANHLAGLVLWVPVNQAMFCGDHEAFSAKQLRAYADAGVEAFLAAYGPD